MSKRTISREMLEAIHAAFDRPKPTADEILENIQRARALRIGDMRLPAAKPDSLDTRHRKPSRSRRPLHRTSP